MLIFPYQQFMHFPKCNIKYDAFFIYSKGHNTILLRKHISTYIIFQNVFDSKTTFIRYGYFSKIPIKKLLTSQPQNPNSPSSKGRLART